MHTQLRQWASTLNGAVTFPDDAAYDSARLVWNRAIDRRPAAIVRCASGEDIVRTVTFARTHGATLAIRSGGHSQAGLGVCDGGLVMDLAGLRAADVDLSRGVVRVSAGARVSDVLQATRAHGLATPMGGCPDVGVGGLTLGGGENFLMARYGIVCDNLLAADVVTADGRVLRASADEHPDLFWALRGGGGNFGVAAWFEYRLHQIGEVLAGQFLFPVTRARDTMLRYRDLMRQAPDELTTSGGLTLMPDGPRFFIALGFCGEKQAGDQLATAWRAALRPEDDTVKWAQYSADLMEPAAPSVGSGVFLPALNDDVIERFVAAIADAPPTATAVWNNFHGAVTRVPQDAMAFPLRQPGFDLFVSVPFADQPARQAALAWLSGLMTSLRPYGRGVYVNNLSEHESDRVREAYGPNYDRLAAIKAIYDPDNLFRMNHNIAPAPLPRVPRRPPGTP